MLQDIDQLIVRFYYNRCTTITLWEPIYIIFSNRYLFIYDDQLLFKQGQQWSHSILYPQTFQPCGYTNTTIYGLEVKLELKIKELDSYIIGSSGKRVRYY